MVKTERSKVMTVTLQIQPQVEERLRALARAQGLLLEDYMRQVLEGASAQVDTAANPYSILDLEGAGAELWQGQDAQEYVNATRDEWERP